MSVKNRVFLQLFLILSLICSAVPESFAQVIQSNAFVVQGALPKGLSSNKLESIAEKMEQKLEWKLKKVSLTFYSNAASFSQAMRVANSQVLAFTRRIDASVHLGPQVTPQNVEVILGHELSHVIFMQKYKQHIPPWIEEGLANLQVQHTPINYGLLHSHSTKDVFEFSHPLKATTPAQLQHYYMGATALAVMLKEKCGPMDELLNLALKDSLEKQLKSYCEIQDINAVFWKWVEKKAKSSH